MLTILAEKPLFLLLGGGFLTALVFFVWLQTYHRWLLPLLAAVVGFTATLVLIERLWETERESLVRTLKEIAATVEQQRLDALLAHIHPAAEAIRAQASAEYNHYQLDSARITQVWDVAVDPVKQPAEAEVKFNVLVIGGTRSGEIADTRVIRYMIVRFRKDGDRWKIVAYEHHSPQEALRRENSLPGPRASP